MNDYLELPLNLDEDETATLYIHLKDKSLIAFNCVDSDPVRYHGVWNFSHVYVGRRCTSLVPAEDVSYFTILGGLAND